MINIFDISTLVTDRTQADVQAWNDKGTYNPSDLNRVTHAMEYLVERIRSYGYAVKYEKVKVPHQPQKGRSRLPAGYTELEYIESTGTQYIDTGFKPNNNTRVVMDADVVSDTTDWKALFSVRTNSSTGTFGIIWTSSQAYASYYGSLSSNKFTGIAQTGRRIYDQNKETTTIGGQTLSYANTAFQCDYKLYLLALSTQNAPNWHISAKLYSCQMYDNGTIIRDYVPCVNSNGTAGLYDLANGVFYENAGSGVFATGSRVEVPSAEEPYDEYTWYVSDIPQERELKAYLQNVQYLRDAMVLLPNTPEVPADMEGFTFAEANDIEQILVNIETIINLMLSSIIYTGEIFSGEVI